MEHTRNIITLRGCLQAIPCFSHENHGKQFYRFYLEVPRLSGVTDVLPVIAEAALLNEMDLSGGEMITVTGQIRSHNSRENGVRRLLIFVYAGSVLAEDGEPINDVCLSGPLCKEPTYRRTPLGREICDVMLAVPQMAAQVLLTQGVYALLNIPDTATGLRTLLYAVVMTVLYVASFMIQQRWVFAADKKNK